MQQHAVHHKDAHVLVTGGTSGIGAAIAKAYADDGAIVSITGTRGSPKDYDEDLSRYRYFQCNVESNADIDRVTEAMGARCDILINNAGMALIGIGLDEWEPDNFARAVNMHLIAAHRFAANLKTRLSASKRVGGGAIVSVGSMSSLFGIDMVPGYGAGKTGLLGITRAMAVKWGPENIRANMIVLGLIETRMTAPALAFDGFADPHIKRTPLGRVGKAEDCAPAALFLTGPGAAYITGQSIVVDGGFSIQG
jgi:NAD(P)-dependent dehydrogenase (short-subunit alcohol dehydrogenase family)